MAELVMTAAEIAADPARWLDERRKGITATDAAVIVLGPEHPYSSPFALWHRKAGNLPEIPDNDRMRLGREMEGIVAARWKEVQGDYPIPVAGGLYRDGWRMATPDALVYDRKPTGDQGWEATGVLECKTVATWDGWGRGRGDCEHDMPYAECKWDDVPPHVRVQALWQADVVGVPVAHVAALHRLSGEFRWYTLDAGDLGYRQSVLTECLAFYQSLQDGMPPPVDGAEATTAALKALHPAPDSSRTVFLDRDLVNRWEDARLAATDADATLDFYKNVVRAAMGDAKYARYIDEEGQEWQIATRTLGKRAGYWVPPTETDTLRYGRKQIQ